MNNYGKFSHQSWKIVKLCCCFFTLEEYQQSSAHICNENTASVSEI